MRSDRDAGKVGHGRTVVPPGNRQGGSGNPPPTGARAIDLPDNLERFFAPVKNYAGRACADGAPVPATLAELRGRFEAPAKAVPKHPEFDSAKKQALADAVTELPQATTLYEVDAKKALATSHGFAQKHANALPA